MKRRNAMLVVSVLLVACGSPRANASPARRSNEPFTSFRLIDKQLSKLNDRAATFKTQPAGAARNRDRSAIQTVLSAIRARAAGLVGIYKTRGDRFGAKLFSRIESDAIAASRDLSLTELAKTRAERKHALDRFSAATLKLVLDYQAVSANYGANHCSPRQWACCEPKNDPETNRGPTAACKWTCVPNRSSCSGFLGPQTLR
jgi:hypothetical protein